MRLCLSRVERHSPSLEGWFYPRTTLGLHPDLFCGMQIHDLREE
jgi:hypothetical protein